MDQARPGRTIVITGANRGIGYALVERLLKEQTPYDIIMTARNVEYGKEAYDRLTQDYPSSVSKLTFQQLDIADSASIDAFVKWIQSECNGKIDVLMNNAAVFYLVESLEDKLDTIKINFEATVELTEKLLPCLTADGKIINISSVNGLLLSHSQSIKDRLADPTTTREKLIELKDQFLEATKAGTYTELGWHPETYCCTKSLLNAYTRWVLAKMVKGDQQCYCLDPGWCKTRSGGPDAPLPVERGPDTPMYLLNLPFKYDERYNGQFFIDCKLHEF